MYRMASENTPKGKQPQKRSRLAEPLDFSTLFEDLSNEKKSREATPKKISRSSPDVALGTIFQKIGVKSSLELLDVLRNTPIATPVGILEILLAGHLEEIIQWACTIIKKKEFNELFLVVDSPGALVLLPPVTQCLNCGSKLEINHQACFASVVRSHGVFETRKQNLRCKNCKLNYNYSMYGSPQKGYKLYGEARPLVEGTRKFYMDRKIYKFMISLSNHAWVSFQTFSEAYNDCNYSGLEMKRKKLSKVFFKGEAECEIRSRCLVSSISFKSEKWLESALDELESLRVKELYPHLACEKNCEKRGCGKIWVADGIWKLCFPHCMMVQENTFETVKSANFPAVCPEQPQSGSAFCARHCAYLKSKGIPTNLRDFLKHCGLSVSENGDDGDIELSSIDDECIQNVLSSIKHDHDYTSTSIQAFVPDKGLLQDGGNTVSGIIQNCNMTSPPLCRHDTGENLKLRKWSRGHLFIVRGGGHIEAWDPLYQSEGMGQVFILILSWLHRLLTETQQSSTPIIPREIWLVYDNMCSLKKLKASQDPLNLPAPFDTMFIDINKCIDGLHIRNHVDPDCKTLLHPNNIEKMYPDLEHTKNTMAAEQTFVWAGRFKRIVCSMGKRHHLFFLHRMVVHRNRYTEKCYAKDRKPLLPSISTTKK